MTVYLDLVMGLNFAVDLLLFLGTNRLAGFPAGLLRCSLAAALGAGYAGVCMLPQMSFLGSGLWRMVFLGLMGMTAFGMSRSAWKRTGIFILLSMAMGGMALCMGRGDMPSLLLTGGCLWLICSIGFGGQVGSREYIPLTVKEGENTVSVVALKDTGNTLRDPITGEQVLILGPDAARKLLNLSAEELMDPMNTMLTHRQMGLRLIPYQAVGQAGGMLLGKRFDNVKAGGRQIHAVIAFAPERIGKGDSYQALAGGML